MRWCERHGVGYILGLARNARLAALAAPEMALAEAGFAASGLKQRRWSRERHGVGYILGLARNARLAALAAPEMALAEAGFAASGLKQRRFAELLRRPQLGSRSPGDRPDRARPQGRQPALHGHQPGGRRPGSL